MKIRRFTIAGGVLLIALLLTACRTPTATPDPTPTPRPQITLTISGSGTTAAILSGIKSAFEADVPGYTLDILQGTGTGGGVEGAVKGLLDVAAMARPPKDAETAQGLQYFEFGRSGVALYTHPDVGLNGLTAEQVRAIFSGEVTNWSEVGGKDMLIILYVRDEAESSTVSLREYALGETAFPETAQVLTSQSDMQTAVAGTPGSVGFGSWPAALAEKANVHPLVLDGIAPGDPAYPMTSPVGLGYLTARQVDVQPLIDWLLSAAGQAALAQLDVIIASQ